MLKATHPFSGIMQLLVDLLEARLALFQLTLRLPQLAVEPVALGPLLRRHLLFVRQLLTQALGLFRGAVQLVLQTTGLSG